MTPADKFIQFLGNLILHFSIWWIVKILALVGLGLYLAFAVIVVRQVGLMAKTVETSYNLPLKLIAWAHLCASVLIFLLALFML